MLKAVLRERRKRKAKRAKASWKKRQSQIDRREDIEKELKLLKKAVEPDVIRSKDGISVGIHTCRRGGRPDLKFEFWVNDSFRGKQSIFSAGDLDTLEEVIQRTKRWVKERK